MAIDPNIKKKADDIRNKIYGKEVRESLASGLEEMSSDVVENEGRQSVVENRQDDVESQWQNVVDETTNLDVVSAPEIIAARDGEANLKARLDKENQEVTAQLSHIEEFNKKFKGHTNSDSAITTLLNTGLSYLHRPLIKYGPSYTAASANNTGHFWEGTHYLMDCSSFTEIALRGVTYENSAYLNNGVNYPTSYGFYFDEDFPRQYDRMLANEQGEYCYDRGWAYKPKPDYSNVQAGDLIFPRGEKRDDFFEDIGHVGIVLDVGQNQNITVLEMGHANQTNQDTHNNGATVNEYSKGSLRERCPFFARIPLKDNKNIPQPMNLSNRGDNVYGILDEVENRKVYTLIFESDNNVGYYAFGSAYSNHYFNFYNHVWHLSNNKYKVSFIFKDEDISPFLRLYEIAGANPDIKNVELFDGVVTDYEMLIPDYSTLITENENGVAIKHKNGIMECFNTIQVGGVTTEFQGGYVSETVEWTYPEGFKTKDPIVTLSSTLFGRSASLSTTPTTVSAKINTHAVESNTTPSNVFVRAIGRWK